MELLPFDMGYLTPEMVIKAEIELGETEEVRKESLAQLRKLIREDRKIWTPEDDLYLLQFLRARKFIVKRGFGVLQNYYHIKKSHFEVYGKPDYPGFMKCFKDKILNILPYRDENGCVIMVVKFINWNPDEMKFSDFVHHITCAALACTDIHPATQVCGLKFLIDVENISWKQVKNVPPKMLQLIAKGLRNCLPIRFKAIHVLHESFIFQYVWNILRVFLSEKVKNRMFFHSNSIESLLKHMNPALLPVEYGGQYEYDNSFWIEKIESLEYRYFELHKYGYKSRKQSKEEI